MLLAAESNRQIEDAKARAAELVVLDETEEECGPPSCCLELAGTVHADRHVDVSADNDKRNGTGNANGIGGEPNATDAAQQQRVCTHSMAGCSSSCKSIATLANPASIETPTPGQTEAIAILIVLAVLVILLVVLQLFVVKYQHRTDSLANGELDHTLELPDEAGSGSHRRSSQLSFSSNYVGGNKTGGSWGTATGSKTIDVDAAAAEEESEGIVAAQTPTLPVNGPSGGSSDVPYGIASLDIEGGGATDLLPEVACLFVAGPRRLTKADREKLFKIFAAVNAMDGDGNTTLSHAEVTAGLDNAELKDIVDSYLIDVQDLFRLLDSDADDSVNLGGNRPRRKASISLVTRGQISILEFVNGLDNMIKMNYAAAVAAAGAAIGDENGTPFAGVTLYNSYDSDASADSYEF